MITTALALGRRLAWLGMFCGLAVAAATAVEFDDTLTPEQQTRSGLGKLTPGQLSTLNALVARELQAGRQGGVRAFAGTFVSRRTPMERQTAGIDQLNEGEQNTLNDLVAAALAQQLPVPLPVSMLRAPEPESVDQPRRLKVHGEVTLALGAGRGVSYQAASFYTEVTDPKTNLTLGIGVGTFRGNGCLLRRSYLNDAYYPGWGW